MSVGPLLLCFCRGRRFGFARNRKQHLASPVVAFAPFRWPHRCLFLRDTATERIHEVDNILRRRRDTVTCYRQACLLL